LELLMAVEEAAVVAQQALLVLVEQVVAVMEPS
jgi:hypothetical protein